MNSVLTIPEAMVRLRDGECIGMPTETVYGLAADITLPKAIDKIFQIKQRPFFDPLIVHIGNEAQLHTVAASLPPLAQKLANKFWPGPLTMILPKHSEVNSKITSGLPSVGVRMPNHPLTLQLLKNYGKPLAAPSANLFGHTSPTQAQHVIKEFSGRVPVLDGGPCLIGVESTVVGFNDNFTSIFIYRPGAITFEMLNEFAPVERKENPAAPGQLKHHYMPPVPLVVLSRQKYLDESTYEQLSTQLNCHPLRPNFIKLSDDAVTAARELYSHMRDAAQERENINCLIINYDFASRQTGLWESLSDRLTKAARLIL